MSRYHGATLALLGDEAPPPRSTARLEAWAVANRIELPAAYLEWARLGGAAALEANSNCDRFFFETPPIVVTPAGARGLLFHQENQGNFDKIVLLDGTDDPPVLIAWLGSPPWVLHTPRFSACVYAQIFDWQYMIEDGEIAWYATIPLLGDGCLANLRAQFEEVVTSWFVTDEGGFTEHRFRHPEDVRLTLRTADRPGGEAFLDITGERGAVNALEATLLERFGADVVAPSFSSLASAMSELARSIDHRGPIQVGFLAAERASADAVSRLTACHRQLPLPRRVDVGFPGEGAAFPVGGPAWGVEITFERVRGPWWRILRIT